MDLDDWFLTRAERGNPSSRIGDDAGVQAWTRGNDVVVLVEGATYFVRLLDALAGLGLGDEVRFTDWRGDGDERLDRGGAAVASVLAAARRRGVDVRGLLWRSHSDRLSFSSKENRRLAAEVNGAGGEVLLDERVRRGGSHHQKLVIVRHPGRPRDDRVFVGGIDLCHGRRDDSTHAGDPQSIQLDRRYGRRPPWHDVQLEVSGPGIGDLDVTFRERWSDPTPLDHSNPVRARISRALSRERRTADLPAELPNPPPCGAHAVQVLRTYPSTRPRYPFAPEGERSVARAFTKAVARARRLIYIEDQYFWSRHAAGVLAKALRRRRDLRLIVVVPRYPDKDGRLSGPPARMAQERAVDEVRAAGGDRVAVYDLSTESGTPIYVHAKVCVIDDVWAAVGSDNLNRRSWTHDSELACAVIDDTLDARAPADPAGLGDGARRFARDLRLALWAEHLGRAPDDPELVDPDTGFGAWVRAATALDAWHDHDRAGPRPPGRARSHRPDPVRAASRWWAGPVYRLIFDPDGRPTRLRRMGGF